MYTSKQLEEFCDSNRPCIAAVNVDLPEGFPLYEPSPEMWQVKAECCGALVWIGPRIEKAKRTTDIPLLCAVCVAKTLHALGAECEPHGLDESECN
jgi:hypothetical protein